MARCKKGDLVIVERGDPKRVTWTCLCHINKMFTITEPDTRQTTARLYWMTPTVWTCDHERIASILDEVCRPIRPTPLVLELYNGQPERVTL